MFMTGEGLYLPGTIGDAEFSVRLESGVALSLCSADKDGILDKLDITSGKDKNKHLLQNLMVKVAEKIMKYTKKNKIPEGGAIPREVSMSSNSFLWSFSFSPY